MGCRMRILRILRNYFFYCGIEKDEYNALKKDAYVSNFVIWRILHFLMAAIFGALFVSSCLNELLKQNQMFYLGAFVYSIIAIVLFFILRKDSLLAQFVIYLSITVLFLFGCFITQNKPDIPAATFFVLLLVTPMFMIDKPFFMAIELSAASTLFAVWMYKVKPYDVWMMDFVNVITYSIIGIVLNIIANSVRIKEFILTREINIQKDLDDLTGLKNKGALTREINDFLADPLTDKGIMFMLDIDRFKFINDTYGHDIGDRVIAQLGTFLGKTFVNHEITGRFGGDEFIVFIKDNDNLDTVNNIAEEIIQGASENVVLPKPEEKISISIGVAIYRGDEKNYSEIFKKADVALYLAKADDKRRFHIFK